MSSADLFGKTDQLDATTLEAMVARFEARGKHPAFANMLSEYLDAMQIAPAATVLDMGCGTGLARVRSPATRAFRQRHGHRPERPLVAVASRLAGDEGVASASRSRVATCARCRSPTPRSMRWWRTR